MHTPLVSMLVDAATAQPLAAVALPAGELAHLRRLESRPDNQRGCAGRCMKGGERSCG
ncbi:MAG: hypothetical protein ABSG86_07570 [Thermoguttaceae bacterium]